MIVRFITFSIVLPYGATFISLKICFALVIPCKRALIVVQFDIVRKHFLRFEPNPPMHFCHFHSAINVEHGRFTENDVVLFLVAMSI